LRKKQNALLATIQTYVHTFVCVVVCVVVCVCGCVVVCVRDMFKRGIHILNQNENYTFIIQIANTILNKCISIYLYKIGNITKAIIGLKCKVNYHA